MKPSPVITALVPAVLLAAMPAQAATAFRAMKTQPVGVVQPREAAAPAAPALFGTCTREGMRKGRYSEYSWCEWFSYFHQFKN